MPVSIKTPIVASLAAAQERFAQNIDQNGSECCENDKEHSVLVGHHLLDCLLDIMYDPYIPVSCQ
jgi:hypothetical protein